MRAILYRIGVELYRLGIWIAARRQAKAQEWLQGRRNWRGQLQSELEQLRTKASNTSFHPLWIHAASLGEMEQGLPLLEGFKKRFPEAPVVVSFFSPSGYRHFRHPELVDLVTYLPLDRPRDARDFVALLQPRMALFVKYEIWPSFFRALHRRSIPLLVAPALFRPSQVYFHPLWRGFFLPLLQQVRRLMVQNEASRQLLQEQGLPEVWQVGDPRFDRAAQVAQEDWKAGKAVPDWQDGDFLLVAGSSWPPEEKLLVTALAQLPQWKLILAPHDLSAGHLSDLEEQFAPYGLHRWSQPGWDPRKRVLLIDQIGLLKYLYRYGDAAVVGGGLGKSLHSSIEPMAYGLPLAFGPAHRKFVEPQQLIDRGGAREIQSALDLQDWLRPLLEDPDHLRQQQEVVGSYFRDQCGATALIVEEMAQVWLEG